MASSAVLKGWIEGQVTNVAASGHLSNRSFVTMRSISCDPGTRYACKWTGCVIGVQDSVKVLAKSLVRNRQYVTKMHRMKANLQAVSLKITVSVLLFRILPADLQMHASAGTCQ
jgi:hypothetical protein